MSASYLHGLIGGMLIGTASVILYWFNGPSWESAASAQNY